MSTVFRAGRFSINPNSKTLSLSPSNSIYTQGLSKSDTFFIADIQKQLSVSDHSFLDLLVEDQSMAVQTRRTSVGADDGEQEALLSSETTRRRPPAPPPPPRPQSQVRQRRSVGTATTATTATPHGRERSGTDGRDGGTETEQGGLPQPPGNEPGAPIGTALAAQVRQDDYPTSWILNVRSPPRNYFNGNNNFTAMTDFYLPKIVRIQITPNMTVDILSTCLQQALGLDRGNTDNPRIIAGLFVEQTSVFWSLQEILTQQPPPSDTLFVLALQEPRRPLPPPTPWWQDPVVILRIVAVLVIMVALSYVFTHADTLQHVLFDAVVSSYETAVQMPLRGFYRHGPYLFGWEGESLPRICARITYHGDEHFWARNLEECERIFGAKEEAWLRVARPFAYVCVTIFWVWALRFIFKEILFLQPTRDGGRRAQDREMVETYRAFHVLCRQVQRAMSNPSQQPGGGAAMRMNDPQNRRHPNR